MAERQTGDKQTLEEDRDKLRTSLKNSVGIKQSLLKFYYNLLFQTIKINPEYRKILSDREQIAGLTKGSLFSNVLYFPNEEETGLTREAAVAGRWVGYDFNRSSLFGAVVKERKTYLKKGRLAAFPLAEVINNSPNKYTPLGLLTPTKVEHLLALEFPTIDELLSYGFIEKTTYAEAFRSNKLYEKYRGDIAEYEIENEKVYRVTPKGNALVFLARDIGEIQSKKEETVPVALRSLSPAFG